MVYKFDGVPYEKRADMLAARRSRHLELTCFQSASTTPRLRLWFKQELQAQTRRYINVIP